MNLKEFYDLFSNSEQNKESRVEILNIIWGGRLRWLIKKIIDSV